VYDSAGAERTDAHAVTGTLVAVTNAGTTVNLVGDAAFTSATSYVCTGSGIGAIQTNMRYAFTYVSGSQFVIRNNGSGGGSADSAYMCLGN
jgi:hypothetical protein